MACSRLLLLLIGVISSHLPEAQARPPDFWCNHQARKNMEKGIEGLKESWIDCRGSSTLRAPVQLPCVYIRAAEWENKTLSQKCAEVVWALQVFQDGVQGLKDQNSSQCETPLNRLLRHVTNYLIIVQKQQIDVGTTPSHPDVQMCSSQTSLSKVLEQYRNLLRGKLERLAVDLQDSLCTAEPPTATTK